MGLGLPDGGHLTHGYYVRESLSCVCIEQSALAPLERFLQSPPIPFLAYDTHYRLTKIVHLSDGKEENDGVFDLLPIFPLCS
jgi:hypothetical protein